MRLRTGVGGVVVCSVAVLCFVVERAAAFSTGITGLTTSSTGCNQCHSGGSTPSVSLVGPTNVSPGSTTEYVLEITTIGSQTFGGLDAAASGGALSVGGSHSTGTQLVSGEITHTAKKAGSGGVVRFSFLWTAPSAPGTFELRAWGNAVNGNGSSSGDRAAFVSLSVNTGPTPTPTATSTATPTPTATPLSHDAVLLPVAPRNIRIPAGATAPVTKKFAVRVRNVDAKSAAAQNFTVSIAGTTCPSGVVFAGPDFDPKTAGVQSTITLNPQQTKPAVVEVSVDRTTITSLKPNLPFRCVVELHADADVMGNTDPSPSNNNVPVELNFFDLGDPAQATPGEAWLARAPATTMVIPSAQLTKTLKKPVVVANGDTMEAALGVNVDLSACPWLTALVDMVPKTAVTEPNVNVAPGKTKAGAIAWSADGSLVNTPNPKAPLRCVATVAVDGPASPDPEPSNDETKVIIDVLDRNDQ